ncbi:MAG: hypothetical protein D6696_02840 [Acidobacteria bacterium]|nr:MAG: hypothetical protein D6696_02840 [Acidobacteriota bacterium]
MPAATPLSPAVSASPVAAASPAGDGTAGAAEVAGASCAGAPCAGTPAAGAPSTGAVCVAGELQPGRRPVQPSQATARRMTATRAAISSHRRRPPAVAGVTGS